MKESTSSSQNARGVGTARMRRSTRMSRTRGTLCGASRARWRKSRGLPGADAFLDRGRPDTLLCFHGDPPPLGAGVAEASPPGCCRPSSRWAGLARARMLSDQAQDPGGSHPRCRSRCSTGISNGSRPAFTTEAGSTRPQAETIRRPDARLVEDIVAGTHDIPVTDVATLLANQSRGGITGEDVFFDPLPPQSARSSPHRGDHGRVHDCGGVDSGLEREGGGVRQDQGRNTARGGRSASITSPSVRRNCMKTGHDGEEITTTIRRFDDGAEGAALARAPRRRSSSTKAHWPGMRLPWSVVVPQTFRRRSCADASTTAWRFAARESLRWPHSSCRTMSKSDSFWTCWRMTAGSDFAERMPSTRALSQPLGGRALGFSVERNVSHRRQPV